MVSLEEPHEKLPIILDGRFFSIASRDEKGNVKAKCTTCKKLYSGNMNSTANFLTHMKVGVSLILDGPILYHFVLSLCIFTKAD